MLSKNKILFAVCLFVLLLTVGILTFFLGRFTSKRVAIDFTVNSLQTEDQRYLFLDKDLSDYICSLSVELELDSDLIVAILMAENPEFNSDAINKNENGTLDCGLFQLNDRYIWTSFIKDYWFENLDFDPFNWKHNTFMAINHVKNLQKKLKVQDEIILAYNCGLAAVMKNRIPNKSRNYLARVKNNITLLKAEHKE